jgi:hypothetical protein
VSADANSQPIALAQAPLVVSQRSHFCLCRAVRAKLISDEHIGCESLFLDQLPHQFHSCSLVSPLLHEQVENPRSAFTLTTPPAPVADDVDGEVLGRTTARTSKPIAGDIQTALREQIFDVAIAERETDIKPNRVPDDRRRELVAGK